MSILFGDPVTPRDVVVSQRQKRSSVTKNVKDSSIHDKVTVGTDGNYVCSLKQEDITENSINNKNKTPSSPGDVSLLQLSNKRLSDISIVDLCERMVVCNLSNNYLKNVSALRWCVNLYCLDLHSNQLTCLPDRKCWTSLKKLQVLYLHDNGIGKLEELRDLSYTPNLVNLTLYDTPISLKKNYRHCVVNAVWSLKALDYCVVSDEEIIEDANFSQRFKPMQEHFKFKVTNFSAREGQSLSLKRALSCINKDISAINRIQATYCPVLVMQKVVRGFLIRLRYNYVMDTRLWAAVSIQRCFRNYKGLPNPPPSTPLLHYQDFMYQSMSSIKLDYEAYLKMRRSMDPSLYSMKSMNFNNDLKTQNELNMNKAIRKRISINLEKLLGKATEMGLTDSNCLTVVPKQSSDMTEKLRESAQTSVHKKVEQISCAEEYAKDLGLNIIPSFANKDQLKVGRYYTQFKFLGPVDQPYYPDAMGDVGFRLSIKKPPMMQHDPLEELVLRTVEGADDIRKAIRKIDHNRKKSVPKRIITAQKDNTEMRLLKSNTGNMGFSCFRAIDKAYRDRSKMELLLKRTNTVKHLKELEDLSLEQVRAHNFSTRNMASLAKKKDKLCFINALASRKQKELATLDKIDAKRNTDRDKQRKNIDNYNFAIEFNCQNASVGKALANHDRSNRKDEQTLQKSEHVDSLRGATEKKRELISGYLENAKLGRQMENICMKRDIHAIINRKLVERFDEQVNRIKFLRENKGTHMHGATLLPVKQFKGPVEHVDHL